MPKLDPVKPSRLSIASIGSLAALWIAAPASTQAAIDFNRDIRPILSDNCFFCHGPDSEERKAGLRLDVEEDAKADLGGYRPVDVAHPEESEILLRILSSDPDDQMPPPESGKTISEEEIALLQAWIAEGATWDQHWAYKVPERQDIPASDSAWPNNWIDQFILQGFQGAGLQPAPQADRATLLRRLSFDLTGLPPTPQELDAFLADGSAGAYAKTVDRLLRSERFGERLAIYWLDLVRYADTCGYHGDQVQNISPYRDYVIEALNDNMPFDQFTREQLAGDLIPEAGQRGKIASGYNRLLQTTHEGGLQPAEYRAIYAADRVRNVSSVWMGATVGCAQCHDHKYDPYTAHDFYAMSAYFADIDDEQHFRVGTNANPTKRPPEIDIYPEGLESELKELKSQRAALNVDSESTEEDPDPAVVARARELDAQIKAIESQGRRTMITVALKEPRLTRLLPRGNWLDESGPVVKPAIPEFLAELGPVPGESRLDFANWLTDTDHPNARLTARVFANRLWYLFFGEGISRSLDDFGGQGQPPSHPELLDQLAVSFVDSGWDIKNLIRLMVTSATYRQSTETSVSLLEADPENRWFARQSNHRLAAEMIRDNALYASGLLIEQVGGASARPYQPEGYFRHLNFPQRTYKSDANQAQWRRGVYTHWQRQFLHPMLKAFDAPSREECTAKRPESNTPIAALTLLNDPSFVEAARKFAERILANGGSSVESRMEYAFRWMTSRTPDSSERETLAELYRIERATFEESPAAAQALLSVGIADTDPQLDPVEVAAWTSIARALLNLNETITRK